jgi:hypothetical protein
MKSHRALMPFVLASLVLSLMASLVLGLTAEPRRELGASPRSAAARPRGDWKVAFHPYAGPGAESMPVGVTNVEGEVGDNGVMFFKSIATKNRSDKVVSRVQFTMFVYDERNPDKILLRRAWLTFTYPGGVLPAGEEFRSGGRSRVAANFLQGKDGLFQPLLKDDGTLEGSYRIELGVSKVYFYDGTNWTLPEPPRGEGGQ